MEYIAYANQQPTNPHPTTTEGTVSRGYNLTTQHAGMGLATGPHELPRPGAVPGPENDLPEEVLNTLVINNPGSEQLSVFAASRKDLFLQISVRKITFGRMLSLEPFI